MSYAQDDEEFESESEPDDREAPDAQDADWNLDPGVIACPYCGKEISEDSSQCPHCGEYISQEDVHHRKSIWYIVGAIVVALIILSWILR